MLDLSALIAHYGVFAIALGAAFEGEAAVITGGALAAAGLLSPVAAGAAAFAGSACADQLLFLSSHRARESAFVRGVRARPIFARVLGWIERRPTLVVLGFRFVYGARIAGPVALGVSSVPARRFVPLNLIAALTWATLFTSIGWMFGPLIEPLLRRIAHDLYGPWGVVLAVAVASGVALLVRRQLRQS